MANTEKLFKINLDLSLNELKNAIFEILSSDPTLEELAGQEARFWYNSTTKKLHYFDGTRVVSGNEITAGDGIAVSGDTVSINLSPLGTHGLILSSSGLGLSLADSSTDGALSSADFIKLSGITTGATKVDPSVVNGNIRINNVETTVYTLPDDVESKNNKRTYTTGWQVTPDDSHYVSEKLAKTSIDAVSSNITDEVTRAQNAEGVIAGNLNTHTANTTVHVTTSDRNYWDAKQEEITGAASTVTTNNLAASKILASDASGKIVASSVTTSELGYLSGLTGNIQDQLNAKQATITGAASTVTSSNLTANKLLVSDANGKIATSSASATEIGYLAGLTGNVQDQLNAKQDAITLSASKAVVSDSSGKIAASTTTATEIGYLSGVTSSVQTQLSGKQDTITGAASSVTSSDLTASKALVSDASGKIDASAVSATELGYLSGVTSNIQTQLDSKQGAVTLTAERVVSTDANGALEASTVTKTELGYLSGVTSGIQSQINSKQDTITGAATSVVSSDLTASKALVSDSSGKIDASSVTATELGYVSGVTSSIQTQLNAKQDTISLTADKVVISDSNGGLDTSSVTTTELGYLSGVTSSIQTQLGGKQDNLSQAQLDAVNSGITSALVTQIGTNQTNISTINGKIPSEASISNQLADKAFVTTAVQTNAANFRGNWNTWSDVPTNVNDYPEDAYGNKTPTANDYLIINDASGYTGETLTGTWRFKYTATWADEGKNGWEPEYQVKEQPLTPAQQSALDSGITSTKVGNYDTHIADTDIHVTTSDKTAWSGKQDAITGAASTVTSSDLTASKILVSDSSGKIAASSTADTNLAKIDYLANVTSDVQTQLNSKQATITGGASSIVSTDLTASKALVSDASGKVDVSTVTATELGYVSGVTSSIQDQLNAKQASITGAATTIVSNDLTASKALVSDANGKVAVSSVTDTELGYVSGVTSGIQSQLNSKQATITGAATSIVSNDLSTSKVLVSDASGKVDASTITTTELGYLSGVTSNIQTQIGTKQDTITGAATTIVSSDLTASKVLVSDASGKVDVSTVTDTELGYLSGVTSAIQTQINSKQATITGAATSIVSSDLTASKILVSDANGKVAASNTTEAEVGYLSGVTSSIQDQLNAKQATITGAATTIVSNDLTASKALVSDANGKVDVSTVTDTELGYVSGVTSSIQTQLNSKQDTLTAGYGIDITSGTISADNIFWATYNSTAISTILSEAANNLVLMRYSGKVYALVKYDASSALFQCAEDTVNYTILATIENSSDVWSAVRSYNLATDTNTLSFSNKTIDKSENGILDNSVAITADTTLSSTDYRKERKYYLNGNGITLTLPNMSDSNAVLAQGMIRIVTSNENTNYVAYYKADGTSATDTLTAYEIAAYETRYNSTNGIYWERSINLPSDLDDIIDEIEALIPNTATSTAVQPVITTNVTQPVFAVDTITQPTLTRTTDMNVTSSATAGDFTLSHNVSGTKLTLTGVFTQPTITNSLTQPAFTASGTNVTISRTTDVSVSSTNSSVTPTITLSRT